MKRYNGDPSARLNVLLSVPESPHLTLTFFSLLRVQTGEGQTGGGQLAKRPGAAGSPRPAGSGGTMARRGAAARRPTSGGARPAGGGQGAGILRFYTDDAPGLKMCAATPFLFYSFSSTVSLQLLLLRLRWRFVVCEQPAGGLSHGSCCCSVQ